MTTTDPTYNLIYQVEMQPQGETTLYMGEISAAPTSSGLLFEGNIVDVSTDSPFAILQMTILSAAQDSVLMFYGETASGASG
jgi:hypothetical protein